MKHGLLKRLLGVASAVVLGVSGLNMLSASADMTFYDNKTGEEDGYAYELWKDTGNTRMTITGDGSFSCEWSNINNCLFRKGRKFDCTQTYQQLGNISIDYAVDFKPNGNSYMCVYGWTRNPLVEYYIVESWGDWRPPGNASPLGTVYSDGGSYDIYKTTRVNQPSIDGDTTFDQYWSVRTSKPSGNGTYIEGTINVSNHFKAWENAGLRMGKMYEVALNIEGYRSSGSATVYGNTLRIGGSGNSNNGGNSGNSGNSGNNGNNAPAPEGVLFNSTFENGTDYWAGRGSAKVSATSSEKYAGGKSLAVTGRQNNWNGAAIELNPDYFKAGSTYSFSTAVLQKSGSATTMQLSMQYDQYGQTKYAQVASAKVNSGMWTVLENTEYTIPSGATNCILYVEAPDSLTDFFMDEAMGGSKGTKASSANNAGTEDPSNSGSTGGNNGGSSNNSSSSSASANLFNSTFENGTDYWAGRGSAWVTTSSYESYAGSQSLAVTGRQSTWNGAAIELNPDYFKAGSTYSFSTAVLQKSGYATTVQLSMQYDQNGQTKYAQVASASAKDNKWTVIENTAYTIPAGASNCILYVEAPDSLTDFYIDEAKGGTAGSAQASAPENNNNASQSSNGGTNQSKPMVAISFDDGTSGWNMSDPAFRIINTLADNDFHATFFYVGDWIRNEQEVKYAYSKGMEIANHTTSHSDLTKLSSYQIRNEFDSTNQKLRNIIGTEPSKLMRLPYLSCNYTVQQALYDVPLISCSIDTKDWNGASSQDIIRTIQNAKNDGSLRNAIVLCHENYASTADAMDYLIPWLKSEGWEVVTVSEMFAANGKSLDGGQVYTKAA